jgi:hypothetical protein
VPRAKTDRFDETRAFALLRKQVESFGHRPAGSEASRRAGDFLRPLLPNGRFEAVPNGLRNIVGVVPGTKPAIVIGAHYDTEALPLDFVGANDSAAGTAAVVELSRGLRKLKRPKGAPELRFVLFDGEEEPAGCKPFEKCGIRGSRSYVQQHPEETRAMILLDYIAEKGTRFPREGSSSIDLWGKLRAAATRAGKGRYFLDEIGATLIDDTTPFLDSGVEAVDIIDFDYPYRDGLQDTVDKVSPEGLDAVGESVADLLLHWSR